MNENSKIPTWKKVLKRIAATLVGVVVLDWLFDGRLRERLPFRRRRNPQPPPMQ
ncbi:MAG: hypothetical protein KGR98_12395 [Verrucomicrobia bacterium]|nr:hypothetical protein [Verrucomicrobiota bacterium]